MGRRSSFWTSLPGLKPSDPKLPDNNPLIVRASGNLIRIRCVYASERPNGYFSGQLAGGLRAKGGRHEEAG